METVAFGNGVWWKFQTAMFLETRSETECKLNRNMAWDNISVSIIYLLLFIIHGLSLST